MLHSIVLPLPTSPVTFDDAFALDNRVNERVEYRPAITAAVEEVLCWG
jgi:hypothetical protein